MKKTIFRTIFFLSIMSMSCTKTFLDKKPLDIISDDQVWNDPALIQAYVLDLYDRSKMYGLFGDFDYSEEYGASPMRLVTISDEGRGSYDWLPEVNTFNKGLLGRTGGFLDYWDYNFIRACNEFLVQIPKGNISEEQKTVMSAEVRFLRAYAYYEMVIRYGGVPLITEPQSAENVDSLFVPRNSEKQIFDFILSECNSIVSLLPETHEAAMLGRATTYAGLALKSRAMLFAASEAKYGTVQLNGLIGMPADEADNYWQHSFDASLAIMDAGKFSLFNRYPDDKEKNYQQLFLEKNNEEIILAKKFISVTKGHNFDYYNELESFKISYGNMVNVTAEWVDQYEMVDGSEQVIDWEHVIGHQSEILKKKDPRFHASVFYNGSPWKGDSAVLYWAISVDTDGDGVKERLSSATETFNGMPQIGKDANGSDATKTGFVLKKFRKENGSAVDLESDQDWPIYRYGEILLNYAEAAFELGKESEALDAVNQIRIRAGLPARTSITLEQIRHERTVELAFETLRWWDLKRWRLAESILNKNFKSVKGIFDWDLKTYYYEVGNGDGYQRVFKPIHYYQPLTEDVVNNNPKLVENPGY